MRQSRLQAIKLAIERESWLKEGITRQAKDFRIVKANGHDRYAEYRVKGTGILISVVTREWQLPKREWTYVAHIGRYIIFTNIKNTNNQNNQNYE